jgi:RNA polymerase sigma-70 factor (ECF subfamily)
MTTDFAALADPFRGELLAHCYRLLGSIHDAEDVVQDTYVRAWRGYERFEGRSSLRRWLYTIATRACLTALERAARRPLPSGLGAPSDDHRVALAPATEAVPWLQPLPDALLEADGADPASVVAARAGIRLAFVAALQHLPARQRAVLILREVLAWPAADVAGMLGTSVAGVNSALQRARAHLRDLALIADEVVEPAGEHGLLDRYVAAFERADVDRLADLVRADVELEMPPIPTWFTGRDAVLGFLASRVLRRPALWRLTPITANGQPAAVVYERHADGTFVPHGLEVLTIVGGRIARITAFNDAQLVTVGTRKGRIGTPPM